MERGRGKMFQPFVLQFSLTFFFFVCLFFCCFFKKKVSAIRRRGHVLMNQKQSLGFTAPILSFRRPHIPSCIFPETEIR